MALCLIAVKGSPCVAHSGICGKLRVCARAVRTGRDRYKRHNRSAGRSHGRGSRRRFRGTMIHVRHLAKHYADLQRGKSSRSAA